MSFLHLCPCKIISPTLPPSLQVSKGKIVYIEAVHAKIVALVGDLDCQLLGVIYISQKKYLSGWTLHYSLLETTKVGKVLSYPYNTLPQSPYPKI